MQELYRFALICWFQLVLLSVSIKAPKPTNRRTLEFKSNYKSECYKQVINLYLTIAPEVEW